MRGRQIVAAFALLVAAAVPASAARLGDRFSRGASTDDLIAEAREARGRADLALAASLLDGAEAMAVEPDARIVHERGLVSRDGGDAETAVELLRRAADMNPKSSARVDLAGVLVDLGRWPEAVVVLRRAFDERGTKLELETVTTDERFVKLKGFEPYQQLVERIREDQAGMVGRLQLRLEAIERAAKKVERGIDDIAAAIDTTQRLLAAPGAAVVAFVLLAFIIASGLAQMRVLVAPWTLVVGTVLAAAVWVPAARVVGTSDGWTTVGIGSAVTVIPICVRALVVIIGAQREPVAPATEVEILSADDTDPDLRPTPRHS